MAGAALLRSAPRRWLATPECGGLADSAQQLLANRSDDRRASVGDQMPKLVDLLIAGARRRSASVRVKTLR